eukprot:1376794-Rhodomonas_salina.1
MAALGSTVHSNEVFTSVLQEYDQKPSVYDRVGQLQRDIAVRLQRINHTLVPRGNAPQQTVLGERDKAELTSHLDLRHRSWEERQLREAKQRRALNGDLGISDPAMQALAPNHERFEDQYGSGEDVVADLRARLSVIEEPGSAVREHPVARLTVSLCDVELLGRKQFMSTDDSRSMVNC